MNQTTIIIIEDDQEISDMLCTYLGSEGYDVISARDGVTGLNTVINSNPDLVLVDLLLPGMSGREICRSLRRTRNTADIPIIIMSSCDDEIDRVVGFEIGADDYVVKPFSLRELSLRIKAVLRRNSGGVRGERAAGPASLLLDPDKYAATVDGRTYPLTQIEYRLLAILAQHPGVIHSRDDLLRQIWGSDDAVNVRVIDAHIKRLRRKLGEAEDLIRTVHGQGYKLRAGD